MVNAWRAHVKKTMDEMKKAAPKGVTVMLRDVLKKAKATYKKPAKTEEHQGKKHHKKTAKKHHSKRKGKKRARTHKKRKGSSY
jgi:Skp family chaperone for outer membrane proteins